MAKGGLVEVKVDGAFRQLQRTSVHLYIRMFLTAILAIQWPAYLFSKRPKRDNDLYH